MNLGPTDRVLRLLLGGAISFYFLGRAQHQWLSLTGILPMVSGSVGWCPFYQLLRLDTSRPPSR